MEEQAAFSKFQPLRAWWRWSLAAGHLLAFWFTTALLLNCHPGWGQERGAITASDASPPLASDTSLPLIPKQARSEGAEDRLLAEALFAEGRILHLRGSNLPALRKYQRAWRYDPAATLILTEIPPLAFELDHDEEAARYAILAAERVPRDPALLRNLAALLVEKKESARAIRLYQKALLAQPLEGAKKDPLRAEIMVAQFELGKLLHHAQDPLAALEVLLPLSQALKNPPQLSRDMQLEPLWAEPADRNLLLGDVFLAAGKFDLAATAYEKVHELEGNLIRSSLRQTKLALAENSMKQARQSLSAYLQLHETGGGAEPYTLLTEIIRRENPILPAEQALQKWVTELTDLARQDTQNGPLHAALADGLVLQKKLSQAEKLLREAKLASGDFSILTRRLKIVRLLSDPATYLELLASYLADHPSLAALAVEVEDLGAQPAFVEKLWKHSRELAMAKAPAEPQLGLFTAARLAVELKKLDIAEELFGLALAQPPSSLSREKILLAWGLGLVTAPEPARAKVPLQKLLDEKLLPSQRGLICHLLATSLAAAKLWDEALAVAREAAQVEPTNVRYQAHVPELLAAAGKTAEAETAFVNLLKQLDPDFATSGTRDLVRSLRQGLSNLKIAQGNVAAGTEYLEQVLDEFPEDAGTLNDLGYIWAERGMHLNRALAMIQTAVAQEPENLSFRDSLGWVYLQRGSPEKALPELLKATSAKAPAGVIWDHLGDTYAKLSQPAQARHAWLKAEAALGKENDPKRLAAVRVKLML